MKTLLYKEVFQLVIGRVNYAMSGSAVGKGQAFTTATVGPHSFGRDAKSVGNLGRTCNIVSEV